MAATEIVTVRPDCSDGLTVEVQNLFDASNGQLHDESQQNKLHQQTSKTAEVAVSADIAPIDPNSTVLDEIRDLREQLQRLQMQASVDSSNAKKNILQPSPDEFKKLQSIKDCLRKHRHEWDDLNGLEAPLSEISLQEAIGHLDNSSSYKLNASISLAQGSRYWANYYLSQITESDDEDDEDCGDDWERSRRETLMMKRREHLRSMELNVESITEELMRMRLSRRLRKKEKAAKLQQEAEMRAAKQEEEHKKDGTSTADEEEIPTKPEPIIYAVPKANLIDWTSFKDLGRAAESISCVIDVLVGEPVIEKESWEHNWKRRGRLAEKPQAQKPQAQKPTAVSSGPRGQGPLPERIRIHSSLFLKIFAKLIDPDGVTLDINTTSVVFLRPFKAITQYEDRIREWLTRRGESIEKQDEMVNPTVEVNNDDKELESPTAMAHLRCVLDFFDAHIAARIEFLQSPGCRKVFYSDLWHVYRPGMEVIGLDGKQAYRVIQVTSSRHRPISNRQFYYNYAYARKDDTNSEPAEFTIYSSYIDFDGKYIGPVLRTFEIKRFEGERDITSLEVYPLRFHKLKRSEFNSMQWNELEKHPEQDRCRANLIQRGAKFVEAAGIKHMYYSGSTMVVREEVESQVVVDFETCFAAEGELQEHIKRPSLESFIGESIEGRDNQGLSLERCECCLYDTVYEDDKFVDKNQRNEYINSVLSKKNREEPPSVAIFPRLFDEIKTLSPDDSAFSDDELVIMSYRVFGFVLRNRKWAQLDLTYLTEVREAIPPALTDEQRKRDDNGGKEKDTAFDHLVLEDGHKDMIVSLITQHFRDKEVKGAQTEQVDIVRGKGKGLILLLHGAPGVGKTSTAEGVAERFRKPLFQITCGDLGVTARDVEKTLQTNFNLATKWGCILLLDEADVFLAQRDKSDFVRNGMVAAFLRVLEYYAGILFLTTNRIGDFDEAFTSRIHISLYYPELDNDKTIDIFKLNLDLIQNRFNRMGRTIQIDYKGIERFAKMHYWWYYDSRWNGRQIRNACQTALALAEYQAQQDSKSTELDSKVPVKLGVDYFETVRNAYLEFTKYLVDLYGASTAAVAEERYLRAKEKANGGRDPLFTTNQLLRMKKDGAEPGRFKSPTLQRKPSQGVYNSGEADQRSWERRSLKSQNASSIRDRNQTDFSSSNPTAGPIQRFLQSERLGQPRDLSQQLDIERESSSRSYNNSQRSKGKRGSQSNWDHDDFEEDGSEYSDTQRRRQNQCQKRRQQEPDGMSEEEQEDDDDDFSLEEEAAPANNRGRREPDEPRYTRNRK